MKDEIKEILFLLHNDRLTESGKRKLEDYITNLQEENKNLKERCEYLQRSCERKEEQRDTARMEYMEQEDYKSRCEKAYNYLDKFIPNEYGVLLTERQWEYVKNILGGDDNG